jgi:photosystem II stability/assembly factor-like uncharacterized protein
MLLRCWRRMAWVSTLLVAVIWLAGIAAAQSRDRPEIDSGSPYFRGLFFINARTGWVAGGQGTILTTADAGMTWQAQGSGTFENLHGLHFSDGLNGWAVGNRGLILGTNDGGKTWERQSSGTNHDLRAVRSLHRARGRVAWAVGLGV